MTNRKAFDDMLTAFLTTYALTAFCYEKYLPENIMRIFRTVILTVFFGVWLWFSFKNGKRKNVIFPIFAVLFWLLPMVVVHLANDGPKVFRMSIIMYVLSELSELVFGTVMKTVSGIFSISSAGAAAVLLLVCAASYLGGMLTEEE